MPDVTWKNVGEEHEEGKGKWGTENENKRGTGNLKKMNFYSFAN